MHGPKPRHGLHATWAQPLQPLLNMRHGVIRKFLEFGAHIGHTSSTLRVGMDKYILCLRGPQCIIDPAKAVLRLRLAASFLRGLVWEGKVVLFLCTDLGHSQHVARFADRLGMPAITDRWRGGTLTNFSTLAPRLKAYSPSMNRMPDALFIVGLRRHAIALREARKVGVPVVAIVDTNCSPYGVDYPIPGNDDSAQAVRMYISTLAQYIDRCHALHQPC
ncbi:30S ribosomal protein S2 [Candidatus Tremblaya princeps]|uniref:Small ribosomal subunit protein uS2 n=1 Tax=Tremblaya princeps TaxID=189385 RepID=A0A143WQ85_TREPR|nr:30S ribosomal protein S2 [Candidatus Tremblaya princeps]